MPNFTKNDLIDHVAEETGLTKTAARKAIQSTLDGIGSLDDSNPLVLRGFGTFRVRTRKSRHCPLTSSFHPEYKTLTFKAARALRQES